MKPKFSLIIPTYNEIENIEQLCRNVIGILRQQKDLGFEVIVVDDNSPDGTYALVEKLSLELQELKAVVRVHEKGLGSAVVCGWKCAQGEVLGVIDGDLQHPVELIPMMLDALNKDDDLDIVVASRNVSGGGISKWSLSRRIISLSATLISHILLPTKVKVHDSMSGYFVFKRRIVDLDRLKPLGYKILLEVLVRSRFKKVKEVGYFFQERAHGGSKAGVRQYLISFAQMLRLSIVSGQILFLVVTLGILFLISYYIKERI